MTDYVLSHVEDGVRTITLDRPERLNAINPALLLGLRAAFKEGNGDPATRVMIFRGAGRAFCAGDDLKDFDRQVGTEAETRTYIESIQDVTREIVFGPKMVVGAVHGWAVGGGLEWVIDCDVVLAARGTRFFFPEISLGVFVTGAATALLPRIVGLQKARHLILFGERFDADDAAAWGLVNRVVPPERLFDEAEATARRIADLPPGPVANLKRALLTVDRAGIEAAMAAETDATLEGFLDPETARRVAGFAKSG